MFTGLIESTGVIVALEPQSGITRLTIKAPQLAGHWSTGDSIAVNGVCLTALPADAAGEPRPDRFAADLAQETIQRTTLVHLSPGAEVNLELPTPAGSPLGGHVVQGHVDGTGTLISLLPLHPDLEHTDWRMVLEAPAELMAYILQQGSITVDGISLTVAKVDGRRLEIAIIPHTYHSTNLHSLKTGDRVNLETDVLSRYAARQAAKEKQDSEEWLTPEYLLANGY